MPQHYQPTLLRAIGRWSLTALIVNSMIGSAIFGLPSVIAGLLGAASPVAFLLAASAMALIVACYAEVGSRFAASGGTYLYVRSAFGRFAGLQVVWFALLTSFAARAASANLIVTYLGEFWPRASDPVPRFVILTALVGTLAGVNFLGVRLGTQVSNIFALCKLLPLGIVCMAGAIHLAAGHHMLLHSPTAAAGAGASWLKAMLLLTFAYGGFENGVTPTGEIKDPRRNVVFALFAALIMVALIYFLIQWVVISVLADPAQSTRPLADVAAVLLGHGGAVMIAITAMISVLGYLSAGMLTGPRYTFALAEQGDFPRWFAALHPRFRTPHFSILFFAIPIWLFALVGNFSWNVTLSAATHLFYYALVCAALPRLRSKQPGPMGFSLPGELLLGLLGVTVCVILFTGVDFSKAIFLAATFSVALLNWLVVRRTTRVLPSTS